MIHFKHSESAAASDKLVFMYWQRGVITTWEACKRIASHNDLKYVDPQEFEAEAIALGYGR